MAANDYQLTFTRAGLEAILNERNQGLKARITHIALGSGAYTPTGNETTLLNEQQRNEIADYQTVGEQLHLAAVFSDDDEYDIREAGIFLEDGTLLAITSHSVKRIGWKAAGDSHIQKLILLLSLLPIDSVTIDTGIDNLNLLIVDEMAAISTALANLQLEQLRQADKIKHMTGAY
jgi:hypothetical protein